MTRQNRSLTTSAVIPGRISDVSLVLRRWRIRDAYALSRLVGENLEHLRPWMPWIEVEPVSLLSRTEMIRGWEKERREAGDLIVGVFVGGQPVGGAGLHRRRGPQILEIGYWIGAKYTGMGYATRAASLLTDLAFSLPFITRVEIHHDRANIASSRVAQRAGMVFVNEATKEIAAPGESGVEWTWAMTRAEWLEARGSG